MLILPKKLLFSKIQQKIEAIYWAKSTIPKILLTPPHQRLAQGLSNSKKCNENSKLKHY
jgi:hypothetical protein